LVQLITGVTKPSQIAEKLKKPIKKIYYAMSNLRKTGKLAKKFLRRISN